MFLAIFHGKKVKGQEGKSMSDFPLNGMNKVYMGTVSKLGRDLSQSLCKIKHITICPPPQDYYKAIEKLII